MSSSIVMVCFLFPYFGIELVNERIDLLSKLREFLPVVPVIPLSVELLVCLALLFHPCVVLEVSPDA